MTVTTTLADGPAAEFGGSDRFEIRERLGSGGFGVVYRAYDREEKTIVALKTLRDSNPHALYRLKNEFRSLQDLSHPNLISLGELLEHRGQWFFTMELVDGVDFISWVRGRGARSPGLFSEDPRGPDDPTREMDPDTETYEPVSASPPSAAPALDEDRLRDALAQLTAGLMALHQSGRIHRDIKPSNVLVDRDGRVVILDLGLVTEAYADGLSNDRMAPVGTVAYMAPEQAASQTVGPEADWYSVGVMLYEALTGTLPFGGTFMQLALAKQESDPKPPHEHFPELPSDLDALCCELLRFEPSARPSAQELLRRLRGGAPEPRSWSASVARTPLFVGRERELEQLRQAYRDTQAGALVSVLVHGASGFGKSELIRWFTRECATTSTDQPVVLSGRCYERESVPFKAFDGVVDALSRVLRSLPRDETLRILPRNVDLISRIFPVLARVDAMEDGRPSKRTVTSQQELRSLAFEALRGLLAQLADRYPVIVVIDDIQWADEDSLRLLEALLHGEDPPPLLLIAAKRTPTEPAAAKAAVERTLAALPGDPIPIGIGELSDADARALAARLLEAELDGRTTPIPATLASNIAREAGGHPFFIQELVRQAQQRRSPADEPDAVRLDDALWTRVQALDPQSRSVVELACVAGGPIRQGVVAEASDIPRSAFARVVASLRVTNLLRTRGPHMEDTVEPYHDRVSESVRGRLADDVRRRCHRRLAQALLATGRAEPELLAHHFEEAGDDTHVAKYAAQAADQAADALAFDHAARLYRWALEKLPREDEAQTEDGIRRSLLVRLGDALANAGRGREAGETYLMAAPGSSHARNLELRQQAAMCLLQSGHYDAGIKTTRDILGSVGLSYPSTARRALWSLLWQRARLRMRGLGFRQRPAEELSFDQLAQIDTCVAVASGLSSLHAIISSDFQTRHLRLALDAGEPSRVAQGLALEAAMTSASGVRKRARIERLLSEASHLLSSFDDPDGNARVKAAWAICSFLTGDFRAALEHANSAIAFIRSERSGLTWELDNLQQFQVWSLYYLGELREFAENVERYRRQALERGDLLLATNMSIGLSSAVHLLRDDPGRAHATIEAAMEQWTRQGFFMQHSDAVLGLCQADLYAGDAETARARIAEAWKPVKRSLVLTVEVIRLEFWHLVARTELTAALQASGRERKQLLRSAAKYARKIEANSAAWSLAWAWQLAGTVAAIEGDEAEAARRLQDAVDGFESAGMRVYAECSRLALGHVRGGEEATRARKACLSMLADQGAARPQRIVAMLVPGPWNDG